MKYEYLKHVSRQRQGTAYGTSNRLWNCRKIISLAKCQPYLRVLHCLIKDCLWLVRLSYETEIKTACGNTVLINLMWGQSLQTNERKNSVISGNLFSYWFFIFVQPMVLKAWVWFWSKGGNEFSRTAALTDVPAVRFMLMSSFYYFIVSITAAYLQIIWDIIKRSCRVI